MSYKERKFNRIYICRNCKKHMTYDRDRKSYPIYCSDKCRTEWTNIKSRIQSHGRKSEISSYKSAMKSQWGKMSQTQLRRRRILSWIRLSILDALLNDRKPVLKGCYKKDIDMTQFSIGQYYQRTKDNWKSLTKEQLRIKMTQTLIRLEIVNRLLGIGTTDIIENTRISIKELATEVEPIIEPTTIDNMEISIQEYNKRNSID